MNESEADLSRTAPDERLSVVTRAYRDQREELTGLRSLIDALQGLMTRTRMSAVAADDVLFIEATLAALCVASTAEGGAVLIVDEDSGELVFVATEGPDSEKLKWQRLGAGVGVAGWVANEGRSAIVNSPTIDERFFSGVDHSLGHETHSLVAVPIRSGSRVLGVVELVNKRDGRLFSRHDESLVTLASHHLGLFFDRIASGGSIASSMTVRPDEGL